MKTKAPTISKILLYAVLAAPGVTAQAESPPKSAQRIPSNAMQGNASKSQRSHEPKEARRNERKQKTPLEGPSTGAIDINKATVAELLVLPGIGPTRADAIIKLRERLGGFQRLRQIIRVRGIGRKTYAALRERLSLDSQTKVKAHRNKKGKAAAKK